MTFLQRLRSANMHRHAEWWVKDGDPSKPVEVTPSFRGNEIAGEVGELCNVLKKLERVRLGLIGNGDKRLSDLSRNLHEEIGDVLICLDLIAMDFDVDLEGATAAKFNATSEKNGLRTRLQEPVP